MFKIGSLFTFRWKTCNILVFWCFWVINICTNRYESIKTKILFYLKNTLIHTKFKGSIYWVCVKQDTDSIKNILLFVYESKYCNFTLIPLIDVFKRPPTGPCKHISVEKFQIYSTNWRKGKCQHTSYLRPTNWNNFSSGWQAYKVKEEFVAI